MKKSRVSLLISNILIYGLNQTLVVLIPMIMLPVYERMLPDISVYGVGSLATTISSLFSSLAIFGMFDAAVRFAFDKDDNMGFHQRRVCSTATFFLLCSSSVAFFLLVALKEIVSQLFYGSKEYTAVVVVAAGMSVMTVWNTASLIPIRIRDIKKYAIANSLTKVLSTAVATIILILCKQYFLAIPGGTLIGLFTSWLLTFCLIGRKSITIRDVDRMLCKEMLKYAAPLMITLISYWIYQSADKIMLSHISNLTEVGTYAIGAKIGAISAVIQNAFTSGWAYFAFSTMNDEDQVFLISKIFRIGILITSAMAFLVMAFIYPIFSIIFESNEYLEASFLCVPLFTAPLFLTVMQVVGTQLLISKNTKQYSLVQIIGAIINVLLNCILIPYFGARGAAVATLVGYIVPLLIMIISLGRNRRIKVERDTILSIGFVFVVIVFCTLFIKSWKYNLVIGLICITADMFVFWKDFLMISTKLLKILRLKRN